MATFSWSNTYLDTALNVLITNSNRLVLCSTQPTTFTQANVTYMLAYSAITSGSWAAIANGATTGRAATLNAITAITPSANGTVLFFALVNTTSSTLYYVGDVASVAITTSVPINIGAITICICDPTV